MKDLNNMYRPKTWEEVSGQENIKLILNKQVKSKSGLSNAYVFQGPSGVGKTTLARIFFKAMNCENLTEQGNPCNECKGCKNTEFDLIELNGANTNSVDDMRNLVDTLRYASMGKHRGVLLDEFHMLSKSAWNCLLKPIEDSPKRIIWMLCTTEKKKVPKTIATRCQVYNLKDLSDTEIFKRLQVIVDDTKLSISDNELSTIAQNSGSNLRQAIHTLEQFSVIGDLNKIMKAEPNLQFLKAMGTMELKTIWSTFIDGMRENSDIEVFLNQLKYDLNTCLKLKLGIPAPMQPSLIKEYREIAFKLEIDKIMEMLEIILDIQAKTSGIWDYTSLFLNGLCKFKKTFG